MVFDVNVEEYTLKCEVTYMEEVAPAPWTTTSDWDAHGYRELEFSVVSGLVFDEDGNPSEAGRNACAAIAEKFAEEIEEELWRQIEAAREDAA